MLLWVRSSLFIMSGLAAEVAFEVILLKNYFGGYWPWRIAASLKSDSFDSALLAIDSSKTAFSFKHFYPPTDGPQPD
jgi:hypothetical protein